MVDAVLEIWTMNEVAVDVASSVQSDVDGNFIRGMIKLPDRLIMMLDFEQAFDQDVEQAA